MSPLALRKTTILNVNHYEIKSILHVDTLVFNQLKISDQGIHYLEKILAIFMLFLLLPLFLIVSLLIRLTMGSGIMFTQERIGKNGNIFLIYKFRTMVTDAESESGPILSSKNDPRVTNLGKILRACHVDELPQLLNVLKGEMSFIGPRPERVIFVEKFKNEIQGYNRRHSISPGITGLAQICLPYDATAKEKLGYDLFYIENRNSVLLNIIISAYTCLKMITFYDVEL